MSSLSVDPMEERPLRLGNTCMPVLGVEFAEFLIILVPIIGIDVKGNYRVGCIDKSAE